MPAHGDSLLLSDYLHWTTLSIGLLYLTASDRAVRMQADNGRCLSGTLQSASSRMQTLDAALRARYQLDDRRSTGRSEEGMRNNKLNRQTVRMVRKGSSEESPVHGPSPGEMLRLLNRLDEKNCPSVSSFWRMLSAVLLPFASFQAVVILLGVTLRTLLSSSAICECELSVGKSVKKLSEGTQ